MKAIFEPVYNTAGVEQLNKELAKDGGRTVMVSGCIDTQKLHFSSAIASNYNFQLVITRGKQGIWRRMPDSLTVEM